MVERRSGVDRRSGEDKRIGIDRRAGIDRRVGVGWIRADFGDRLSPEQALNLVADFYSASMDDRFWPAALAKLKETLGADVCALARHDFTRDRGQLEQSVGVDVSLMNTYSDPYAEGNPWLKREDLFREPGAVLVGAEIVKGTDAAASEFFQRWMVPQGLEHQLFGVLERNSSEMQYLFAARSAQSHPFGDADKSLLRRLLPYLQRGLRAGQVLRRSQNVRQLALDTLDLMPMGIVLISLGGAVLATNRVARAVMAERQAFNVGRSGLEIAREGRISRVRDLIADAIQSKGHNQGPRPFGFSVSRPNGQRPLSIWIWPVRALERHSWDDPAAVMFIGDPDYSGDIDEGRLRQLYGLTAAEARVAALLASGYRLDEIAEMLDVAYETTRKHLKRVLSKAHTDRQAELVRMIMTGPGGLVG
ncbi:MAG: helix-turn-helix transcriptional regulator [Rhodospirillales bacterium]|nr:MAG: helix-turn-helix transcriptional regulator [Rhodospirillales bacterium]